MRQTRLSIGCQDWQEITANIGPAATGVLLYLRLTMRKMQAAEITISTAELAEALKLDVETVGNLLCMILDAELLDGVPGPDGLTTYQSKEEAAALADRFRKRASSSRRKLAARIVPGLIQSAAARANGNSGYTLFDQTGNSVRTSPGLEMSAATRAYAGEEKEYTCEAFMIYDSMTGGKTEHAFSDQAGNSEHAFSDQAGNSGQAEKEPHTPQKEKSLTEISARPRIKKTCAQSELPADALEAEYIDVCGGWPKSLRKAIMAEKDDIREAFYLYVRQRQTEDGKVWTADQARIAWLAARRIPEERRAESILAASMGKWKTIRDCGSGVYFEKSTGRIVSLVRGTVETKTGQSDFERQNSELAALLARNMRRD